MNNKNNARWQATHALIEKAAIEIFAGDTGRPPSVTDICRKAQINRASFYLHFRDIYELAAGINADILRDLMDLMTASPLDGQTSKKGSFIDSLRYLKDHRSALLLHYYRDLDGSLNLTDATAVEPFHSQVIRSAEKLGIDSEREAKYHARFLVAGFHAIVARWMVGGCEESPEQISELLSKEYLAFDPE